MGTVLSYSLFSSIILSLLYLTYKWVMAGENQHGFNRGILWAIYGIALLSPLSAGHLPDLGGDAVPVVAAAATEIEVGDMELWYPAEEPRQPLFMTVMLWVYLAGVAVALIHTVIVGMKLRSVISRGERVGRCEGKVIVVTADEGIAPFSWYRYVVMNRRDYDEDGEMILTHELRHLRLCHWVDLLLAQAVGVFQWYNPAAWLMREELKTIHEYQADSAVLRSGVCVRDYQMLLIKKAVGARFPSLANSLNHSKLKKRITMMFNQKTSPARRMRGLALVPALVAALAVTDLDAVASVINATSSASLTDTQEENNEVLLPVEDTLLPAEMDTEIDNKVRENLPAGQEISEPITVVRHETAADEPLKIVSTGTMKKEDMEKKAPTSEGLDNKVFTVAEKKPQFPGGDKALLEYVGANIRYPEEAFKAGTQGRVIVQFVVKNDGAIGDVKVLRSVDKALDNEAIRVVKSLPAFTPGMIGEHPVAVWYTLPVSFRLTSGKTEGQTVEEKKVFNLNSEMVKKEKFDVYIDGTKLDPEVVDDISPDKIESITVKQATPTEAARVEITMKH